MSDDDWLYNGVGSTPEIRWSFLAEAPLATHCYARESGETIVADRDGGFYRLDRNGRVASLVHGSKPPWQMAWSDTGQAGVIQIAARKVQFLDRALATRWTLTVPADVSGIAIDPHGHYVAVSLSDGHNILCDEHRRELCQFASVRPLRFMRFLSTRPLLVGAAEHGLLALFDLKGQPEWTEPVWTGVGDMCCTGDGSAIGFAGFAHGVLFYNRSGQHLGTAAIDGTAVRVACSYGKQRVFVATQEGKLMAFDKDGGLDWGVPLPETLMALAATPFGESAIVGLESGRVLRLG